MYNNSNKIHIIVTGLDNVNKINNTINSDKYKKSMEEAIRKVKEIANDERFKPKFNKDKLDAIRSEYMNYINNDDCDFDDEEEITNEDIMDAINWFIYDYRNWRGSVNRSLADIHADIIKFNRTSNSTKKDLEAIIADRNREINEKAKIIKDLKARLKEYENTNAVNNEPEECKDDDEESEIPDYLSEFLNSMNDAFNKYFHSKDDEE